MAFVGICGNRLSASGPSVERALKETVYSHKVSGALIFDDRYLVLGKSSFNFLASHGNTASANNVQVWVDGEIFHGPQSDQSFAETLLLAYGQNTLTQLLAVTDGVYVAIIYDANRKRIQVITDRYGLKPFYLYHRNNHLILAAEVKCFPLFTPFNLGIRKDIIDCFLHLEHFLGTATWFEGVEVADPSTIYTYSIEDDDLSTQRYWSWSAIAVNRSISFDEAAEEMAALFDAANKLRIKKHERTGVSLSGGLDSRAILAAVRGQKPLTFTFGLADSADVRIARQVARLADVQHIHYNMQVPDWLVQRFSGVWKTDGMLNMYHMHYSHLMNEIPQQIDVNLSGFLGDAMLGGSYLDKKGKKILNRRINASIASQYYGQYYTLSDPSNPFFDLDKADPYLFYNRGRRMIGMGLEEAIKTIHQRLPFMDTRLMDFSFSLPDEFRIHSKVYNRALLKKYPEFFRTIARATTGVPITDRFSLLNFAAEKYHHLIYMVKYKLNVPTSFTDVNNWIREKETAEFIGKMLDPRTALYPQFTSRNFIAEFLLPHLQGKRNFMKQVMGALTVEIWLQQTINKNYRQAAQR